MAFFNLYRHGFARIRVATPRVRVADPAFNAAQVIAALREAEDDGTLLTLFPELCLSAYTCDDLFLQQALLDGCVAALEDVLAASRALGSIAVVGVPLQFCSMLFNCAAVIHRGRLCGIVPKTYLPNYREFYEARQFASGDALPRAAVDLPGHSGVPFGSALLFEIGAQPRFTFHVEICEDLWVPIPPSSFAALAGATVLLNLSASNATVGKAEYRQALAANQSARCLAAYAYASAGAGESTTDLAWDGHAMIHEDGVQLAESRRFLDAAQAIRADIDLDRLCCERARQTSFAQSAQRHRDVCATFRTVRIDAPIDRDRRLPLARTYERFPYVPSDPALRDRRCGEIYDIQVQGLVTRMRAAHVDKLVIGVSGGLDSTHALLVCARAMDVLRLPRGNIVACTLPGFATSKKTSRQARQLIAALGCAALDIDIRTACLKMFADIGHPFARGERIYDATFENVQAGMRTSYLFRLANLHRGLVVGTSDLSELALGWCTYGVGDHMAHYGVNASVPKTLIRYLIRWAAQSTLFDPALAPVLQAVLDTAISPELIPGNAGNEPEQRSEDVVGPFELQDFALYYVSRFGYRPSKLAFIAWHAWRDATLGAWPDPGQERHQYTLREIKHWLRVFVRRFFEESQFKRSCVPNAPKVGSGGSLSPRGDYRAPSDASAAVWLADLETVPDEESAAGEARPGGRDPL
ncbi:MULTISPECIES: NAD(+) synthase [Burkholderia]|uniref:Glutamine-dependent NAD(+) synthetase n=1 Tax=Burkholderia savannae TaxID=1637837 RepID=A0ABR5TI79_9BURK|nr:MULTISPECIES: NAD(+) synthase [Burkholderia]KGR93562.1 carbon-nitrogen hydrolase family protein [Burkholderia sp. ABCPW 111]KWZ40254.1 NAD synthetase [Burkholderia savannae]KWZ44610.1 NAD synthetase [Burkholderia savannae]